MTSKKLPKQFGLAGASVLSGIMSSPRADVTDDPAPDAAAVWIALDHIQAASSQPRRYFDPAKITALANSFQQQGFKGAINVRPLGNGKYEVVAGERRYRAAQEAGLEQVACIVDDYNDEQALEFALVENLLREDLSKLEETEGILDLIELKFGIARPDAIALIQSEGHPRHREKVGGNDSPSPELQSIISLLNHFNVDLETFRTKHLRLLNLPQEVRQAHLAGKLDYTKALEIAKVHSESARSHLLQDVLHQQLSVREIKDRVREINQPAPNQRKSREQKLVDRLTAVSKQAKRQKNWQSSKVKELETLLNRLEQLMQE